MQQKQFCSDSMLVLHFFSTIKYFIIPYFLMQHFHHIRLQEVIKSLGNLAASLLKTSETILIGSRK